MKVPIGEFIDRKNAGPRKRMAKMIAARIVLAVAALNLLFLLSELGMNAFRAYFG